MSALPANVATGLLEVLFVALVEEFVFDADAVGDEVLTVRERVRGVSVVCDGLLSVGVSVVCVFAFVSLLEEV